VKGQFQVLDALYSGEWRPGIRMGNRKRFLGCTVLRDVIIATELSRPRPSLLYYLGICAHKLKWNHDVAKVEALLKATQ